MNCFTGRYRVVRNLVVLLGCCLLSFSSMAKITLPTMLSDHAVLQQQTKVMLYGKTSGATKVRIFTSWDRKTHTALVDKDSEFFVHVKTPAAGGPYHITFNDGEEKKLNDIMIGEVWFCSGQSNMAMTMTGNKNQPILHSEEIIASSANSQIRLFTTARKTSEDPLDDVGGSWAEAAPDIVAKTSALAYQFAQKLQAKLNVPVGVIVSSWGGTPIRAWMSDESLSGIADTTPLVEGKPAQNPSTLYNGMVAPFTDYTIRGVLWYQGENDRLRPETYREMMPAMVKDWRMRFKNKNMPFYFVQIAPWNYPADKGKQGGTFSFRQMQYELSKIIPNSGIAVTSDIGSNRTIHPPDKTTVAERLLRIALAKTYGFKEQKYLGPEPVGMEVKKDIAWIKFSHAEGGLVIKPGDTDNFEIAGQNGVFYPAVFKVNDTVLEVWSNEVSSPASVRYGAQNYFQGNLFNKDGLPSSTFTIKK